MKKNTYKSPGNFKEVKCKVCNRETMRIDGDSVSGTCFRCVIKSTSPNSVIITDLSTEDYIEFIQKTNKKWKTQEQPS